jgi:hypothetical protein
MPNIDYVIRRRPPGDTAVRIRDTKDALTLKVEELMKTAVGVGANAARARAPRGQPRINRLGRTIRESIAVESHSTPTKGGPGGGAFWEGRYYVDTERAPQAKWVLQGTPHGNIGDRIYPKKKVFEIKKEGRVTHPQWVSGQKAQTAWWNESRRLAEEFVKRGIRDIKIPEK